MLVWVYLAFVQTSGGLKRPLFRLAPRQVRPLRISNVFVAKKLQSQRLQLKSNEKQRVK
jgi:hypothetical protein